MPCCCVPHCSKRGGKADGISFYRIPKHEKTRRRWLKNIRREVGPAFTCGSATRICSWHFPKGKSAGPIRFQWNASKYFDYVSPEKKQRKKQKQREARLTGRENLQLLSEVCEQAEKLPVDTLVTEATNSLVREEQREKILMQAENVILKCELERLREKLRTPVQFSYLSISSDPAKIALYTSFPDSQTFEMVVDMISRFEFSFHSNWNVKLMPLRDMVLLTLMKMRLNLPHLDLATRFGCSKTASVNIFRTLVQVMHEVLYMGIMHQKIPSREKNQLNSPKCFSSFRNCRVILDCTEISVAKSEILHESCATFSNYKSRNTLKGLVGVAPNGVITFASELYAGSTSDKAITRDCGILDLLVPGDLVLADKGFAIEDILPSGVQVNHPSFLMNPQFTPQEVVTNKEIARARIHVERAIQRIKLFHILDHIPQQYKHLGSKLFQLSCCLANLQTCILPNPVS